MGPPCSSVGRACTEAVRLPLLGELGVFFFFCNTMSTLLLCLHILFIIDLVDQQKLCIYTFFRCTAVPVYAPFQGHTEKPEVATLQICHCCNMLFPSYSCKVILPSVTLLLKDHCEFGKGIGISFK